MREQLQSYASAFNLTRADMQIVLGILQDQTLTQKLRQDEFPQKLELLQKLFAEGLMQEESKSSQTSSHGKTQEETSSNGGCLIS